MERRQQRPWWLVPAAVGGVVLALAAIFASIGGPHGPATGLLWLLMWFVYSGIYAGLYLLAAAGLGRAWLGLTGGAGERAALEFSLGLATLLTLSHAMGLTGLLSGAAAGVASWAVLIGCAALLAPEAISAWRGASGAGPPVGSFGLGWTALAGVPAVALLLAASASPPGWLWDSEFGAYDALSYHLQLPREWIGMGGIIGLEHNVYSFLPSYMESAYMHLVAMGGGYDPTHMLHAALGIAAALIVARGVHAALPGVAEGPRRVGAGLGAALALAAPWVIVVGSLAYNELGMLALLSGAMVAALDRGMSPGRRGLIAGVLVGAACGCKPTALVLGGPLVGLLLLGTAGGGWPRMVGAGVLGGLAALAPWLIRNWAWSGNPVFPHAAWLFGTAHWTAEQAARYGAAHTFPGPLWDRIALLASRARGLGHPQWSIVPVLAVAGWGIAAWWRPSRRVAVLLGAGAAAQIVAWMFATHLQSRFLLPLVLPAALGAGLAGAWAAEAAGREGRRALGAIVLGAMSLAVLGAGLHGAAIFARQRDGMPNAMLLGGFEFLTGRSMSEEDAAANPVSFVNRLLPRTAGVYLLGDATPLLFDRPVLYHTTWDTSPLGEAIERWPGKPAAWTAMLRSIGVEFVLVNFSELVRLHEDGWYDPRVTPQIVERWVMAQGRIVHAWAGGRVLVQLVDRP